MPRPIKRHPLILHRRARHHSGNKTGSKRFLRVGNAEQFYQYQPTEIILSEGRLSIVRGMVLLVSTITPIPAVGNRRKRGIFL